MAIVDPPALATTLLATERDVDQMGWDQPDLLFAIHGPWWYPQLEYTLQFPGRARDLLHELYELGLRVREDILGLVLVVSACRGRIVLAVLSDGYIAAVLHEEGDAVHVVERIPDAMGDHETMTSIVMQFLGGSQRPGPRA